MNKLLLSLILFGASMIFGSVYAAQAAQPAQPYDVCAMNTDEEEDDDVLNCGTECDRAGSVVAIESDDEEDLDPSDFDDDDDEDEDED